MPHRSKASTLTFMHELLGLAPHYRRAAVALFLVGVALYAALLLGLATTRKPWNDEAMSALAGYNLSFHGHTGVSFYDEKASGYAGIFRHSYYIFPFQLCVFAIWYRIVPFTLMWTRVLAMLWAFVGLARCSAYCAG